MTTDEVATEPATTTLPDTTGSETSDTSTTRGICGDHIVDPGEQCDDGNHSDGDGCQHNCVFPGCGDGALDRGEMCDDGNLVDSDGCSSACVRDAAYVFVSSALYSSDLDGLSGGDNKCQTLATAAGLPGIYQAWLSIDITSATSRIVPLPLPYIRTDGVLVADSFAALVDAMPKKLKAPISVTETGEPLPLMRATCLGGPPVWTGTDEGGLAVPAGNCNGWEQPDALDAATAGKATATDAAWTRGCGLKCADMAHLYCFEVM
jgi:cysteine-rich repeat protein